MKTPRCTIYVVESFIPDSKPWIPGNYYHSFLMKVREDEGQASIADYPANVPFDAEAIHYSFDKQNPDCLIGIEKKSKCFNDGLLLQAYVNGEEDYINEIWQRAQKLLPVVRGAKLPFSIEASLPHQFNCRSGVEASLAVMGFKFVLDDPALPRTGLGKNLLGKMDVKDFTAPVADIQTLQVA